MVENTKIWESIRNQSLGSFWPKLLKNLSKIKLKTCKLLLVMLKFLEIILFKHLSMRDFIFWFLELPGRIGMNTNIL